MKSSTFGAAIIGWLAITLPAYADKPAATNEDLRHLAAVKAPLLSPDGTLVLFELIESAADGGRSHLWVTPTAAGTGAPRQLTTTPPGADADAAPADPHGETDGAWLPNGAGILFLAKREKTRQLFHLPLSGGEAQAYTLSLIPDTAPKGAKPAEAVATDVTGFAISPDGKTMALLAEDPETPEEKSKHDGKDDAVWVDHDPHRKRLALLDLDAAGVPSGAARAVPIPDDVGAVVWSPTSDRLLALTEAPNDAAGNAPADKAWLVERAAPEHAAAIAALPSTIERAIFSPDGKSLAFDAQAARDAPPGFDDLYLYDFANQQIRDLTDGFEGGLAPEAPTFTADGKSLVFAVARGVTTGLARVDLAGGAVAMLTQAAPVITEIGTNLRQTGWVFLGGGSDRPTIPWFTDRLDRPAHPLSMPPSLALPFATVAAKTVTWQNDGLTIEGLLYLPPSAVAGHPVPLIVDVHGGPLGTWNESFFPLVDLLVARGWAVLLPNPRGSDSYGAPFAAANKNDLGGGDFRDIMTGVDAVLKQYPIDPARLALIGYSYGGEMAGYAEGKTTRFKTIVSGAPVIDQYSEYGTEAHESWYDRWYFGKPWEHPEDAWRQSPLAGAAKAKTPFLLLQGESDTTDPKGQSEEMYRALRQEDVPVDLVTYPRETHGTLGRGLDGYPTAEPWHGFDARRRMLEALEKAFGGK